MPTPMRTAAAAPIPPRSATGYPPQPFNGVMQQKNERASARTNGNLMLIVTTNDIASSG